MPFANAGILIASASGSEVEFTNGDQPGVRLAKTAARPAETAGASKPTAAAKTVSGRTANAGKRRR